MKKDLIENLNRYDYDETWVENFHAVLIWNRSFPGLGLTALLINPERALLTPMNKKPLPEPFTAIGQYIHDYFNTVGQTIPLELLDHSSLTPFAIAILKTLLLVPRGKTVSYGDLADMAGCRGRARAVGTVMTRNPFPLLYPCHRVIKSTGYPGNYQGGSKLKQQLLAREGIIFQKNRIAPESII